MSATDTSAAFARPRQAAAPEPAPHPAPEVPARPAAEDEIPRGARGVRQHAQRHGWTVAAWYARGTTMDRRGLPGSVVDSLSLRMERGAQAAVALWVEGKYRRSWTSEHRRGLKSTELRAFLAAEP